MLGIALMPFPAGSPPEPLSAPLDSVSGCAQTVPISTGSHIDAVELGGHADEIIAALAAGSPPVLTVSDRPVGQVLPLPGPHEQNAPVDDERFERWLRQDVVAAHDEYVADPGTAVSLEAFRESLAARRAEA